MCIYSDSVEDPIFRPILWRSNIDYGDLILEALLDEC